MSLLTSVTVENFRLFKRMHVAGLTRLNLIVGPNDSGKTALLEALEWHLSGASPERLYGGLERRSARLELDDDDSFKGVDIAGLFRGRQVEAGPPPVLASFSVQDDQTIISKAEIMPYGADLATATLELRSTGGSHLQPQVRLVARRGFSEGSRRELRPNKLLVDRANVHFVSAGVPSARDFGPLWKTLAATPDENLVVELLRHVDPKVERFAVVSSALTTSGYSGIVLLLAGSPERLPLSDFGDGMKRMAFLACALAKCRGGSLLIDELDDGLHYSVLPRLWEFLAKAARQLDVQVFATTHSKDCLEAIALLHARDATLTSEISIHRLEKGAAHSAAVDAGSAATLIDAQVELR